MGSLKKLVICFVLALGTGLMSLHEASAAVTVVKGVAADRCTPLPVMPTSGVTIQIWGSTTKKNYGSTKSLNDGSFTLKVDSSIVDPQDTTAYLTFQRSGTAAPPQQTNPPCTSIPLDGMLHAQGCVLVNQMFQALSRSECCGSPPAPH